MLGRRQRAQRIRALRGEQQYVLQGNMCLTPPPQHLLTNELPQLELDYIKDNIK